MHAPQFIHFGQPEIGSVFKDTTDLVVSPEPEHPPIASRTVVTPAAKALLQGQKPNYLKLR